MILVGPFRLRICWDSVPSSPCSQQHCAHSREGGSREQLSSSGVLAGQHHPLHPPYLPTLTNPKPGCWLQPILTNSLQEGAHPSGIPPSPTQPALCPRGSAKGTEPEPFLLYHQDRSSLLSIAPGPAASISQSKPSSCTSATQVSAGHCFSPQ